MPSYVSPLSHSDHLVHKADEFRFRTVTSAEIQKIVQSFPSNKAPGRKKMSMAVVKDALLVILPVLTDIVNRSLLTSVFPSAWKESEVVPILKDEDHEIPNNNRPVSLLPVLSEIHERVALNQLTEYKTRRNSLTEHQIGNRKNHSRETLNIFMRDTTREVIDQKQVTALVFLDLLKAFDSIDHKILLKKLRSLGTSSDATEWFRSYLIDRSQSVEIGSDLSDSRRVTHGVPQWSILGPTLLRMPTLQLPS